MKELFHGFLTCSLAASFILLVAAAARPATAEALWSDRRGSWQVTLFRGGRGDAWCSWTFGGEPGLGRSQRSMSLQMRGEELVLFLFVGGLSPPRWHPGDAVALNVDDWAITIELDHVRLLANGFLMSRGVVARGAEAVARLATGLVNASSVSLLAPDGTSWGMNTDGLNATMPLMQQCLREAESSNSSLTPSGDPP